MKSFMADLQQGALDHHLHTIHWDTCCLVYDLLKRRRGLIWIKLQALLLPSVLYMNSERGHGGGYQKLVTK